MAAVNTLPRTIIHRTHNLIFMKTPGPRTERPWTLERGNSNTAILEALGEIKLATPRKGFAM